VRGDIGEKALWMLFITVLLEQKNPHRFPLRVFPLPPPLPLPRPPSPLPSPLTPLPPFLPALPPRCPRTRPIPSSPRPSAHSPLLSLLPLCPSLTRVEHAHAALNITYVCVCMAPAAVRLNGPREDNREFFGRKKNDFVFLANGGGVVRKQRENATSCTLVTNLVKNLRKL
jgi:hypothetical protein